MGERDESEFDLLDRFLSGQGTPEELAALARRIESDGALRDALEALKIASRRPVAPQSWDAQAALERLQRELQPTPGRQVYLFPHGRGGLGRTNSRSWRHAGPRIAAAAAIVLAAAGGAALWLRHVEPPARVASAVERPREISTTRQERATLDLADGSRVVLGPESRLVIPATFNRESAAYARDVELEGDAVFAVAHDARRPFRVRVMGAVVTDFGTRFELRAYANDSAVSVAVSEGSVVVAHATSDPRAPAVTDSLVLAAGDLGVIGKDGRLSVTRKARLTPYFTWVEGDLVFERAPLPEVVRAIGRWYDLDVRVPDERLATRLVNAQFSTQSPSAMLDALATAVGARVEREGRVVTLVPER
jgi:ferric-dicitrate binding protein FerR (iron transport regulator)